LPVPPSPFAPPSGQVSANEEGPVSAPDKAAEPFALFAQNERNGGVFYGFMAVKAASERHKTLLRGISANCRESSERHVELHKRSTNLSPVVADKTVNDSVSFNAGIKWAIQEESLALSKLFSARLSASDDIIRQTVSRLIEIKMLDLHVLNSIAIDLMM
jgi:hypothetical protein